MDTKSKAEQKPALASGFFVAVVKGYSFFHAREMEGFIDKLDKCQ
jgi:hypothetical protein